MEYQKREKYSKCNTFKKWLYKKDVEEGASCRLTGGRAISLKWMLAGRSERLKLSGEMECSIGLGGVAECEEEVSWYIAEGPIRRELGASATLWRDKDDHVAVVPIVFF